MNGGVVGTQQGMVILPDFLPDRDVISFRRLRLAVLLHSGETSHYLKNFLLLFSRLELSICHKGEYIEEPATDDDRKRFMAQKWPFENNNRLPSFFF